MRGELRGIGGGGRRFAEGAEGAEHLDIDGAGSVRGPARGAGVGEGAPGGHHPPARCRGVGLLLVQRGRRMVVAVVLAEHECHLHAV